MGGFKKKGRKETNDLPDNLLYKGQLSVILLYMIELQINPRNYRKKDRSKVVKDNFRSNDNSRLLALTISF